VDAEVKGQVLNAVTTAKAAPMPGVADLMTHVYNRY
jgi:TPP-dependent pyruvate/acetoin dehydrogenase alpha subunit